MILPLELLCQAVLAYESFKALKAAPPPRKRRNAHDAAVDGDAHTAGGTRHSSYALNKRKRGLKLMLRAWLLYVLALPLETLLNYFCGWWLPFYSSFRTVAVIAFVFYHKTAGDIAYVNLVRPFLSPREPSLDWIFGWVNEVLDVTSYVILALLRQVFLLFYLLLSPFRMAFEQLCQGLRAFRRILPGWLTREESEDENASDQTARASDASRNTAKTPRPGKKGRKPRLSQMATPYVPGHLVADESIYPPIQPRLHPSERSFDDLPAFQEAMDRAQAAFYEATSPPPAAALANGIAASRSQQDRDPFLTVPKAAESNGKSSPARRRKQSDKASVAIDDDSSSLVEEAGQAPRRPSAKALGKRRAISAGLDQDQTSEMAVPEKVAKTSRRKQVKPVQPSPERTYTTLAKQRPARPKGSTASRLPTRVASAGETAATQAIQQAAGNAQVTISQDRHKAREAALLARKNRAAVRAGSARSQS